MTNLFREPAFTPDSIHLTPLQAQLCILENVRNNFLYGRAEDTVRIGYPVLYLCWEIDFTVEELQHRGHSRATTVAGAVLKEYILKGLDAGPDDAGKSLGSWLYGVGALGSFTPMYDNRLHLCRLAWLDRMIESLTTEGKLP